MNKFRINVWHRGTGNTVFDNEVEGDTSDTAVPDTFVGGGSIAIDE